MESHSQRHLLILFLSIFKDGMMVKNLFPLPPIPSLSLVTAWHLHFIASPGFSDFENEP